MSLIQDGPIASRNHNRAEEQAVIPPMIEVNEQNFMEVLGQTSMQMPVVTIFYSEASPASQKMKSQFEAIIAQSATPIQLSALNIDNNKMLASQLQIASVPTVMAFFQGQPLDGFAGPQDDNFIRQFLGRITGQDMADPNEAAKEALKMAQKAFDAGEYEQSIAIIQQVLQAIPTSHAALAMLLRVYARWQGADAVAPLIENLTDEQKNDGDVQSALKAIELSKNAVADDVLTELKQKYEANPEDLNNILPLAQAHMSHEDYEKAMDLLLIILRKDASFEEGKAKQQLLDIFAALGGEHPLTQKGRKQLASLLF